VEQVVVVPLIQQEAFRVVVMVAFLSSELVVFQAL
jgi:hypothetical protein